jgi:hypothetical protein
VDENAEYALVPRPEVIVALIKRIVTLSWPDREADQAVYLRQLGFEKSDGHEGHRPGPGSPTGPPSSRFACGELVSTELPVSSASWASYRGELFSVNVFVYSSPANGDNGAVAGFRSIYAQLHAVYGPPTDATLRAFDEATALWEVNGTSIEMYSHTRDAPGLQLGFTHTERNAAYEANLAE